MTTRDTFGEIANYPALVSERVYELQAHAVASGELALVDTVPHPTAIPEVQIPDLEKPLDLCGWWEKRVLNDGEHHSQTEVWQAATGLMSTMTVDGLMDKDFAEATADLVAAATAHMKDMLVEEVDDATFVQLLDTFRNI